MEPPTYQYARYWDWIKPWVEQEVDANTKHRHIAAYGAELELSINVLSLIEQVERLEESELEEKARSRLAGDVIQYPLADGGPRPYIMWEMQRSDALERKEDQQADLAVVVHQISCSVSDSLPTGDSNLALLDVFRSGHYYQGIQGGGSGASGSGGRAAHHILKGGGYGRGANRRSGGGGQGNRVGRQQRQTGRGRPNQASKPAAPASTQKERRKAAQAQEARDVDADSEDASGEEDQNTAGQQQRPAGQGTAGAPTQATQKNVRFVDDLE